MNLMWIVATVSVVFWNVENFYDYHDDGKSSSDSEFSSLGVRHWTKKRFEAKCAAIARTVFWIGDNNGELPDVVAFAEVENRNVLWHLIQDTGLKKMDYEIVHYDSGDHRGIDVALLYRRSRLHLLGSFVVTPSDMQTRDILFAEFLTTGGDSLLVSVNHHPSKYGGKQSVDERLAVASKMMAAHDSLLRCGWKNQLAVGDFNDTPDGQGPVLISGGLQNSVGEAYSKGEGTIRFDGKWELIDMAFNSDSLEGKVRTQILRPPFLLTGDSSHSGRKPLRTYSGPRYLGGVSDHFPIMSIIDI